MSAPITPPENGSRFWTTTTSGYRTNWSNSMLSRRAGPPALLSCLSRVVTPYAIFVSPQVIFDNSTPVDEYLFDRRSLSAGWSGIQTSSFLMPRKLFEKVRFDIDSAHDDWEFVLAGRA
jgi:hypothetical protein